MKYDIFLLDADDTLFDFQAAARAALEKSFAQCSLPFSPHSADVYMRVNNGLWSQIEKGEITREQLIERRFSAVLKELSLSYDDKALNAAYVKNLSESSHFIAGAHGFLEQLKSLGDIYIVTNGFAAVQRARMEKFAMSRYAKGAFISEEVGFSKPDVRFMTYVFAHIPGFSKERAVLIGDGLNSDMKAAQNGGIASVWFNPSHKPNTSGCPVTFEADSYDKILSFLRSSD